MEAPSLAVANGKFSYIESRMLFSDINFSLQKGEILTILGPNGVGKTTLLKCVTGLLDWGSGETLIGNKPIRDMKAIDIWRKIGYVSQARNLVFSYSVLEMVLMGRAPVLGLLSMPSKKDEKIALRILELVEITHLKDKFCSEISGGELQLVLIARALASEPEIIVLDEPETHLDFKKQLLILNILKKLATENGITCLINTHYPNNALRIADKTLMLGSACEHIVGKVDEVITETVLKDFFGVEAKMLSCNNKNHVIKMFCPIAIANN